MKFTLKLYMYNTTLTLLIFYKFYIFLILINFVFKLHNFHVPYKQKLFHSHESCLHDFFQKKILTKMSTEDIHEINSPFYYFYNKKSLYPF